MDKTRPLADRLPKWAPLVGLVCGGAAIGLGIAALAAGHALAWIGVASGGVGVVGCFGGALKRLGKASE